MVSCSSCICKTITILLRIRVRGHFVMSITKKHESHYVTVLDNPQVIKSELETLKLKALLLQTYEMMIKLV